MKKIILLIVLTFIFLISGCGIKNSNKGADNMNVKKSLVLYFSATNNTKDIAYKIKEITKSDIEEIIPEEKYTSDDLNYNNSSCRANREQTDESARPKIKNNIDISEYDLIYLGYPIWWGTNPKIILTLLDNIDFTGKEVVLFCTSGGSGIEESVSDLKNYKNLDIISYKRFESSSTNEEISSFISKLITNDNKVNDIYIKVNGKTLKVSMEDNSSSIAFVDKLKNNDVIVNMHDYGHFEKVGDLNFELPKNDKNITTEVGDVILYEGNKITIYYDKNNWNFTKLGKINNITQDDLINILGTGDVNVTFTLDK